MRSTVFTSSRLFSSVRWRQREEKSEKQQIPFLQKWYLQASYLSSRTQLFARLTSKSRLQWRALGSGSVIAELGGADPLRVSWICPHWSGRSLVVLYLVSQRRKSQSLDGGFAEIGRE